MGETEQSIEADSKGNGFDADSSEEKPTSAEADRRPAISKNQWEAIMSGVGNGP